MLQSTITNTDTLISSPTAQPPVAPPPKQERAGIWHKLRSSLPTASIVGVLAGLAWWGHHTDWTVPKFSTLIGNGAVETEKWCKEHNVPEAQCIECNKDLVPALKDYGWCKEHGIPQCPLHHPEVAQLKTAPIVSAADMERAGRALALLPRAENNKACKLHQRRIQFVSTETMDKAGIDIAIAQTNPIIEAVVANGELMYDETHTAHLASRVGGTVWRVEKQVGSRVRKGDILALIDAAEIGRAKGELLQAITQVRLKQTNVERLKPLASDGAVSGRQLLEAEAALREAQIHLLSAQQALINFGFSVRAEEFAGLDAERIAERIQYLGVPAEMLATFKNESPTSNLFPLCSPLEGVVVERKVVPGEVVDTSTAIFSVADVRQMWLMLDVRQSDAKYLSLGQRVLFRPSDTESEPEIKGTLAWISTKADERTRTVKVRVNLPNSDGRLRANTFGTGRIVLREEDRAVVIPSEAVHWDGCCKIVFVRDKDFLKEGTPKFFHVRKVRVGVKDGDTTEIIVGLLPGEVIASKNSTLLEQQLLKGNLGAGCGCADGH